MYYIVFVCVLLLATIVNGSARTETSRETTGFNSLNISVHVQISDLSFREWFYFSSVRH